MSSGFKVNKFVKTRVWDIKGKLVLAVNSKKAIENYKLLTEDSSVNVSDVKMINSSTGDFNVNVYTPPFAL